MVVALITKIILVVFITDVYLTKGK